jgi:hypothetical protein
MSTLSRLVLTFALPLATWLLLKAPDLPSSRERITFGVIVFFQLSWIWMRYVTRAFRGDQYTYGVVISALAGISCLIATVTGVAFLFACRSDQIDLQTINYYLYLVWLLCLVFMWALPIASTSPPERLPQRNDRREFDNIS